jgi:hypothetical protein
MGIRLGVRIGTRPGNREIGEPILCEHQLEITSSDGWRAYIAHRNQVHHDTVATKQT